MGRKHYLPDLTEVHLSIERVQMESDEKIDKIETDISTMERSLKQIKNIAVGR